MLVFFANISYFYISFFCIFLLLFWKSVFFYLKKIQNLKKVWDDGAHRVKKRSSSKLYTTISDEVSIYRQKSIYASCMVGIDFKSSTCHLCYKISCVTKMKKDVFYDFWRCSGTLMSYNLRWWCVTCFFSSSVLGGIKMQ